MQEDLIVESMISRVTAEVSVVVKDSLAGLVEKEVTKALSRAVNEGEFYKSINEEMRTGLGNIYKEISSIKQDETVSISPDQLGGMHQELFSETTDQLDQVIKSTEDATFKIMDIVESLLTRQDEIKEQLSKACENGSMEQCSEKIDQGVDYTTSQLLEMMTVLSFQDLTGQRIKHTIQVLKKIEEIVTKLYVSTGLMIKDKEQNPEKDLDLIKKETNESVNQAKVDDMLSEMGF